MADAADPNLDELKRRGRRRLIGAVVLALVAAVVVPMLLESEPKPLGEDISVRIPPVDDAKPANRLIAPRANGEAPPVEPRPEMPKAEVGASAGSVPTTSVAAPTGTPAVGIERTSPAQDAVKSTNPPAEPSLKSDTPRKSIADAEKSVLASGSRTVPLEPSKAALDQPKGESVRPVSAPTAPKVTAPSATPPASTTAAGSNPPPPKATTPAAIAKDGYVVQLGAFTDDKGATALANRLRKVGHPAYTESLSTSRGALWRVRVGPYPTRDAALQARDRLKAEGQAGIVVQAR